MLVNSKFNLQEKVKPILKWAGGKSSLLPTLLVNFPNNFHRYIEPFLGGGAVFFSLDKNIPAIINDFNPELFNLYSVIQNYPHELMAILDNYSLQYSEKFFYELRNLKLENTIEVAAKTIFLNKTCFNGLYRKNLKGDFNVPFGKKTNCPRLYNLENIISVSEKLKKCTLLNKDFDAILSLAQKGDFIYCDPPYEPISSTSSFNQYNQFKFSQAEQIRLFENAKEASLKGAFVIISNSSAPFILDLYKEFKILRVLANRSINSNGLKRGKIEEVLIIIPPLNSNR